MLASAVLWGKKGLIVPEEISADFKRCSRSGGVEWLLQDPLSLYGCLTAAG